MAFTRFQKSQARARVSCEHISIVYGAGRGRDVAQATDAGVNAHARAVRMSLTTPEKMVALAERGVRDYTQDGRPYRTKAKKTFIALFGEMIRIRRARLAPHAAEIEIASGRLGQRRPMSCSTWPMAKPHHGGGDTHVFASAIATGALHGEARSRSRART